MKKFFGFILICALVGCSDVTISKDELQIRQGLFYKVNDQQPFSGFVTESYSNNQTKEYFQVKNGRYDGEYSTYYENGQLKSHGILAVGNGEVLHYDQNNTKTKINFYFDNDIDPYEVIFVEGKKYFDLKEPDCEIYDLEHCAAPKNLHSYHQNTGYRKKACEGTTHRCNLFTRYKEGLPTRIVLTEDTIDGWVMTNAQSNIVFLGNYEGNNISRSYFSPEDENGYTSDSKLEFNDAGTVNFKQSSSMPDLDFINEIEGVISFEGDKEFFNGWEIANGTKTDFQQVTTFYKRSTISLRVDEGVSSWSCAVLGNDPSEDSFYYKSKLEDKKSFSEFEAYLTEIGCLELLNEEEIKSFYQKFYVDLERERIRKEKEAEQQRQQEAERQRQEKAEQQRQKEEQAAVKLLQEMYGKLSTFGKEGGLPNDDLIEQQKKLLNSKSNLLSPSVSRRLVEVISALDDKNYSKAKILIDEAENFATRSQDKTALTYYKSYYALMRENDQEAIGYYEEVISKARYTSQSILSSSYCNLGKLYFKTRLLPEALMNQLFCMAHSFLKYEKYFVRDLELLSSIYWLGGLDAEAKNVINEGYKLASRTNASLSETGESLYNLLVQNQNVDLEFSDEKIVTEDLFKDGDYIPLFKVQPVYPRRAQERGVEGYAIVAFTITESGTIENPYVVEGKCRSKGDIYGDYNDCSMFNSATLRAALKLKYKPRVIDGDAVKVNDVLHRFTYELED